MGFMAPTLPDVDIETWRAMPRGDRVAISARHWVEHGFGSPTAVYLLYVVKCACYLAGAALVISFTPGIGSVFDISQWWDAPIVYQKLIVWTLLYEVIGLGCGSGPLTSKFNPPIGSILYWLRPGTIRLPPWPDKVPGTRGDRRTVLDVALYAAVLASAGWLLTRPGDGETIAGFGSVGFLNPWEAVPLIASLALLGLRDQTIFLAARGEQYWLSLLVFFFPYVDMFIGFKLVMLALWWGAAVSKMNHHFPHVVATMMSNAPLIRSRWVKRKMYRNPPEDLQPSRIPRFLAHAGTATEFGVPLFLVFFGQGGPLTWAAVVYMTVFHLNILSTVPMGVPLEWNLFFLFSLYYLFGAHGDLTIWDLDNPLLLLVILPSLVLLPVIGNLRPDKVSFLPAMRYYAGNWATSIWLFRGDAADRMEDQLTTACRLPVHQLETLYDPATAEILGQKVQGWRAMHTHGRAHNGLIDRVTQGEPEVTILDGELIAGFALGWNFGEGHLHDEQLLASIQARCQFAPGELRLICLESQPMFKLTQDYRIYDAADGLLERGQVKVQDMLDRQPWPTDGPDYPVYNVETFVRTVPDPA